MSKLELINEKKKEDLSGVISKLDNLCAREFMSIVGNPDPIKVEIDLLDAIQNKKIVYFQMNTNGYADTSTRIGKLIIQDLKLISSLIQSGKARGLHLFFQGSADLRNVSEVFEEQVLGNTIVKIIFRQDVNSHKPANMKILWILKCIRIC